MTRISLLKGLIALCLMLTVILHSKVYKMKQIQSNFNKVENFQRYYMVQLNESSSTLGNKTGSTNLHQRKMINFEIPVKQTRNVIAETDKHKTHHKNLVKYEVPINDREDKISEFYTKLGVKVKRYSFPKVFSQLAGTDTNTSEMLKQIQNNASIEGGSSIPEIILQYPDFKINMPNFVMEDDKRIFLMMDSNTAHLGYRGHDRLKGHLAFIPRMASFGEQDDCGWKNNITDYMKPPQVLQNAHKDTDIYSTLLVPDSFAFQHFIDGSFPKIVQMLPFLKNQRIKLIVLRPRDSIVNELIQKLGIAKDRLIFHDFNKHTMKFQLNGCITPPLHPILWDKMRDLIGVTKHLSVPISNASVILLTRAGNRNGGRSILNKQEVIHYLTMRYGKNLHIFKGGYSLDESLKIFGKARIILGVHGGAFYNLNFCPKETVVIEYQPNQGAAGFAHTIMWSMAEIIGLKYYRLYEKSITSRNDVNLSIHKLKKVLDEVDIKQMGLSTTESAQKS